MVEKKADVSIQVCADFSTAVLEDHQYSLPVDIFSTLNGSTCFAKLDITEAYLQVKVSATSRELLTINTHHGLFQYRWLLFMVKTALAIF